MDTFAPIYKLNSVKSLLAVSNSMLIEAIENTFRVCSLYFSFNFSKKMVTKHL